MWLLWIGIGIIVLVVIAILFLAYGAKQIDKDKW